MGRTASRADFASIHLTGGTLLIGLRTDPDITLWQKKLRQERLSLHTVSKLHRGEHAATAQLRHVAHRLGLSTTSHRSDHAVTQAVLHAIDTGQAAAVFLPDNLVHLRPDPLPPSTPPPAPRITVTLPPVLPLRGAPPAPPRLDVARMTPVQRIEEMLKRVVRRVTTLSGIKQELRASLLALLSPESLALLAVSLGAMVVAQFTGAGEFIDAGLAGLAYFQAGTAGLWAVLDFIASIKDAASAQNEADLDNAAALCTGALIVLGTTVVTVGFLRRGRGGGGKVTEEKPALPQAPTTSRSFRSDYKEEDPFGNNLREDLAKRENLSKERRIKSEAMRSDGKTIAGAGSKQPLRDEPRLISQHGGKAGDWAKKVKAVEGKDVHWYENISTGKKVEPKIK